MAELDRWLEERIAEAERRRDKLSESSKLKGVSDAGWRQGGGLP